jgi:hypothetical protein
MGPKPLDVVIAGVNKAGTTSLFVSLAAHPQVVSSAVKETRFFLPARYGRPVRPVAEYERSFEGADGALARLEATPSYFYGGDAVASAIDETLPGARIIVVLREPVARAISFFQYQKTRLRLAPDLTIEDYLVHADSLTDEDFLDPDNECYYAVRGGRYADFLPDWLAHFGTERLRILTFEELTSGPAVVLADTATWLGLDPVMLPNDALAAENRTMGFKSRRFQRLALGANDRFERLLRKHPTMKRRVRRLYLRLNGQPAGSHISADVRRDLAQRFVEPNARLAAQLTAAGVALPAWLDAARVGTP